MYSLEIGDLLLKQKTEQLHECINVSILCFLIFEVLQYSTLLLLNHILVVFSKDLVYIIISNETCFEIRDTCRNFSVLIF